MTHAQRAYDAVGALLTTMVAGGVTDVVVSPGSRSTPLVVAAARVEGLRVHVVLDERSAGFVALGMATVSERPTALICTSGSATANYLPAVVEANRGRVPLVVLTADRPAGFLDHDAPQTIDQIGLYGVHVRSSVDLPVAHEAEPADVRFLTAAAIAETLAPDAGPVHINVPFDKPLEPEPGWRPEPVPPMAERRPEGVDEADVERLQQLLADATRPVLVAGPRRATDAERLALRELGIPVLADPLSGFRESEDAITSAELVFRVDGNDVHRTPDLVVRTGGTPTGRATQQWLEAYDGPTVILDPDLRWTATGPETVLRSSPELIAAELEPPTVDAAWTDLWAAAEARFAAARRTERSDRPGSEVALTAQALESAGALVWCASSMPIRHVDVMAGSQPGRRYLSNRGANGIDGTIASAAGAALASGAPVTAILGDLAFLHDVGSLKTARDLGVDLTLVVLDNGGGAIFSMLPIVEHEDVDFDRLFFTPHGMDLVAIASGFGVDAHTVDHTDLSQAIADARGVTVLVACCDPADTHAAYGRMVFE